MNIRVDLNTPINDGTEVVFRSPVDCSQVTGLIMYYQENGNTASKEFAFADAHGNNVGDIDHLFAENAVVKVILDLETSMAFVQNADTNAYLEGKFKDTIDKLCPSFTESGSVVACEPVEGYPLEVAWETKNLINPIEYMKSSGDTTLDGDVFTTTFDDGGLFVNRYGSAKHHPAGTYTVSVIPVSEIISFSVLVYYKTIVDAVFRLSNIGSTNGYKLTFTATEPFRISIGGPNIATGGVYGTYSYKLQLEKGTTATAYEPYAETATITRCGKNLCATDVVNLPGDGMNKTIWSGRLSAPLTVSADLSEVQGDFTHGGAFISYVVDGNTKYASLGSCGTGVKIESGTLTQMKVVNYGKFSGTARIRLETGLVKTAYEPYNGGTFAPGEPITAISGVNTIYADAGLVTVTGKADPVAIINKLTNAILSLGGNV